MLFFFRSNKIFILTNLAPICLFVYNRLDETIATINSLNNCELSSISDLYIFSDGPKNSNDYIKVCEVRSFLNSINGFKNIVVYSSDVNLGLSKSVISGVDKIISIHKKVIVLEDDLVLSKDFLVFMNSCLDFYLNNDKVFNVSGYSFNISIPFYNFDNTFTNRPMSWGWATWLNRWNLIDWNLDNYNVCDIKALKNDFNKGGSDLTKMLIDWKEGRNNSWAIRYAFNCFLLNKLDTCPVISKVENIGFNNNATHTNRKSFRYNISLSKFSKKNFRLRNDVKLPILYNLFFRFNNSILIRIIDKIINYV